MQNLGVSKIRFFCNFVLPIILIFQLLFAVSTFSIDSHNHIAIENSYDGSSLVLAYYGEDLEDEDSKSHSLSWNTYYIDNFCCLSSFTTAFKEYFSSLNHSRSPPLS